MEGGGWRVKGGRWRKRKEGGRWRKREEGVKGVKGRGKKVEGWSHCNQTWFKSAWYSLAFSGGHLGSASSFSMWSARRWSAR